MTFLLLFLLSSVLAQTRISLNGLYWMSPLYADFNYFQGGNDWGGQCVNSREQQTPISLNSSSFSPVSEDQSHFRPIRLSLEPIGANFLPQNVSGTIDFYVMRGYAVYDVPGRGYFEYILNLHVTAPAEHLVDGQRYPLELHIYLAVPRPDGQLIPSSIYAVMIREGSTANPLLAGLIAGEGVDLSTVFPASGVLSDYVYYTGSEDRPYPWCYTDIGVVIPNYVLEATREQISYYEEMYVTNLAFSGGRGNTRDIQPTLTTVYRFQSQYSVPQTSDPAFPPLFL